MKIFWESQKPFQVRSINTELSGIVLGYRLDDQGFKSWQGLGIFLFTTMSRPVLGTTQPPIQWVPGSLSLRVKWLGHEADHSPLSSAEVKNMWRYISIPSICLQSVMLSYKAQG
jgi:hypothetical protein